MAASALPKQKLRQRVSSTGCALTCGREDVRCSTSQLTSTVCFQISIPRTSTTATHPRMIIQARVGEGSEELSVAQAFVAGWAAGCVDGSLSEGRKALGDDTPME